MGFKGTLRIRGNPYPRSYGWEIKEVKVTKPFYGTPEGTLNEIPREISKLLK
jgi:hypothetical protein